MHLIREGTRLFGACAPMGGSSNWSGFMGTLGIIGTRAPSLAFSE